MVHRRSQNQVLVLCGWVPLNHFDWFIPSALTPAVLHLQLDRHWFIAVNASPQVLQDVFACLLVARADLENLKVIPAAYSNEALLKALGRPAEPDDLQVLHILVILGQVVLLGHELATPDSWVVGTAVVSGWHVLHDAPKFRCVLVRPLTFVHQVGLEVGGVDT